MENNQYGQTYPDLFHDWLTSDKILDQLKYRYEREIIHGHRSAIKSIVEDDDISPAFPMVLCVSNIMIRSLHLQHYLLHCLQCYYLLQCHYPHHCH